MPMFNQKGIAHLFLIILLFIGVVIGISLVQNPQVFSPKADETRSNMVGVYTLESPNRNSWYWADNQTEINTFLTKDKYTDKGVLFFAYTDSNTPGTVPLYRVVKMSSQLLQSRELDSFVRIKPTPIIFLTTSQAESDLIISNNIPRDPDPWKFKDAALFVYPPNSTPPVGSTPIYRLIRTTPAQNQYDYIYHYYTNNQKEVEDLMATGNYRNEGIVFYGVTPNPDVSNPSPNPSFAVSPSPFSVASSSSAASPLPSLSPSPSINPLVSPSFSPSPSLLPSPSSLPSPSANCPNPAPGKVGDLNKDLCVDALDVGIFITDYKDQNLRSDIDNDSDVDIFDFRILIHNFGI